MVQTIYLQNNLQVGELQLQQIQAEKASYVYTCMKRFREHYFHLIAVIQGQNDFLC